MLCFRRTRARALLFHFEMCSLPLVESISFLAFLGQWIPLWLLRILNFPRAVRREGKEVFGVSELISLDRPLDIIALLHN
jgi:hypothetical protein